MTHYFYDEYNEPMDDWFMNDEMMFDDCLLTNFNKEEEPVYREAIKQYGRNDLFISSDAYYLNGAKAESLLALRCTERKDFSEFWRVFDRIKRDMVKTS